MGAWGIGHFENDDAGDWVWELEEAKSLDPVIAAFAAVEASPDYIEAPDASIALAAAETVAALLGKAAEDLPESVANVVAELSSADNAAVADKARSIVEKIAGQSELRDLWEESALLDEWQAKVDDLLQRLR